MIRTSYFAKAANHPNAVAISQGIPQWYHGARYKPLAPSWEIIHIKDPELYRQRYFQEVLSKLDPSQVASELDGCILLCHEKDSTHCHRRIVAEWLEAALGITVPEIEYRSTRKMKERAIYFLSGGEYAGMGLNLYSGCSHNCSYCYNKRSDRYQGPYDEPAKKASLRNIEKDLEELQSEGNRDRVHISFMGDPYDMGRKEDNKPKGLFQFCEGETVPETGNSYTRKVLKMFRLYDHPFQILTKGGMLAARDFDLYGPNDRFGVTLTFDNDTDSKEWEPGAALQGDRMNALKEAKGRGIRTWVSMEPVIEPQQTLHLIELTHEFVDFFWIGKLNHFPDIEKDIDWPKFRSDVEALLQECGKQPGDSYSLKHELREAR